MKFKHTTTMPLVFPYRKSKLTKRVASEVKLPYHDFRFEGLEIHKVVISFKNIFLSEISCYFFDTIP